MARRLLPHCRPDDLEAIWKGAKPEWWSNELVEALWHKVDMAIDGWLPAPRTPVDAGSADAAFVTPKPKRGRHATSRAADRFRKKFNGILVQEAKAAGVPKTKYWWSRWQALSPAEKQEFEDMKELPPLDLKRLTPKQTQRGNPNMPPATSMAGLRRRTT